MKRSEFAKAMFYWCLAFSLVSCSKVSVRKTGSHTYFLKCYYSREKCDAAIRKACRDEDKVSHIISRKEKMEGSFAILPFGFLSGKRPVNYVTLECVEWQPKAKDSTSSINLNNWVQPRE